MVSRRLGTAPNREASPKKHTGHAVGGRWQDFEFLDDRSMGVWYLPIHLPNILYHIIYVGKVYHIFTAFIYKNEANQL